MNRDEFNARSGLNVSCETFDRLASYVDILVKWNSRINLVGRSTETDLWTRHVLDSAQIVRRTRACISEARWIDLGSGGGFPGLIISILSRDRCTNHSVTLVEADTRKCVFLSEVSRSLGLGVTILNKRIERIEPLKYDFVSARALAPLDKLLEFSYPHLHKESVAFFLKGSKVAEEIDHAGKRWIFDCVTHVSETHSDGFLLELSGVRHA